MVFRSLSMLGLAILATTTAAQVETGTQPELTLGYLVAHLSPPNYNFRLPPTFQSPPSSPPSWQPTPAAWFQGTWYFYASNQATYHEFFEDIQWTLSAVADPDNSAPTPQLHDLTTGFLANTSKMVYEYGIDTPIAPDAYAYQPTGPLAFANNTWEVLSWGYDTASVPFAVVYETQSFGETSASLDFISRSASGITDDTFRFLQDGVRGLCNEQLKGLLKNVTLTPQDSRRNGQPYPSCNSTCQQNAYALT